MSRPTPSPMSTPSADRSNGRICCEGESARSIANVLQKVGSCTMCAPPTSIVSARPRRSSRMPASTAISDDAQAASTVYAGPRRSSRLAIREAARFGTSPIAASGRSGPSFATNAAWTRSTASSGRSGSTSRSVTATWRAVLTRCSMRAKAGPK